MEGDTLDCVNQISFRKKTPGGQFVPTGAFIDPNFGLVAPSTLIMMPTNTAVPATPPSTPQNLVTLFARPNGNLYVINSSGAVVQLVMTPSV